jgi:hypothetical protein
MSMDGFAVAKAIGTQHDDQRFSASFDLSPSTIATNAGELAQCFTTDMLFLDRATVINTHADQYIYADTVTETFEVFTVPKFSCMIPPTDTGAHLYIGSLGDDMSSGAIPVSMTAEFFRGTFVGLVPKETAIRLKLPMDEVAPDQIPGPTIDGVEGAPPSLARLNAGNVEVVLTSMPTTFPVPRGVRLQPNMNFTNYLTHNPELNEAAPLFPVWAGTVIHATRHNDGFSMDKGGPLFNQDEKDDCPTHDFFVEFHSVGSIKGNPCIGLPSTHRKATEFRHYFQAKTEEAFLRVGKREMAHNRIPEAFKSVAHPAQDALPGPVAGDAIASAITSGIEASILARLPTVVPKSQVEKSHDITVNGILTYFQILCASQSPDGIAVPATINPAFEAIMAHPSISRQVESFAAELEMHIQTLQASDQANFYFKNMTLDADLVKGPLGCAFLRTNVKNGTLNSDPEQCKTQFSILAVTTPRPNSMEYREYMNNGTMIRAQDMVDEHHSKRAAKAIELCISGQVSSDTACVEAVCNLYALYSFVVTNFEDSILWTSLASFVNLITGKEAKNFFRTHVNHKQVFLQLFVAAHNIFRLFNEVALQPRHKKAVRDGTPLDFEVFKDAIVHANHQMRKLLTDFHDQVADFTKTVPNVHVLYPHLQLGPRPTPKPVLQASQEPNAKRAKTAPNQDVSAQKSLTQDAKEQQKLVGFLTYTKTGGRVPDFNIFYADNQGVTNRLCVNGITRGRFCRYGSKCANHHPKKLTDIPEAERRVLIKNVEQTDGLDFVAGAGPAGTK